MACKIRILSDLHIEMDPSPTAFANTLKKDDADILILAGDITVLSKFDNTVNAFKRFCEIFPHVILVYGNHEFLHSSPEAILGDNPASVTNRLKERFSNLDIASSGSVFERFGHKFVCSTMWYPFQPDNHKYENMMIDFKYIRGHKDWVYDENERAVKFLEKNVTKDSIVVTHMMPTQSAVDTKYTYHVLNRFFVCPQDELILKAKPKMWIWGHSHSAKQFRIGKTLMVCNARGYEEAGESVPGFNPNLTIEV